MPQRVLVLGAGFGGLELSTMLSEEFGEDAGVTLIDKSDAFVFGFSKLDVMFGRTSLDAVRLPYRDVLKPGVTFRQETITAIDPETRTVTTDAGKHEADVLVVALGADYDVAATPGLAEAGEEFYSVAGAQRVASILPTITEGRIVIGVCGAPFKCPPAPSECALMLADMLTERGVRDACDITFVMWLPRPVPPSPAMSEALEAEFAARGIHLLLGKHITALDPARKVALLEDGGEVPFDLFLGVPRHRAPDVVIASGMTEEGYVPVESATLRTRYDNVFAFGDVATAGVPKAGTFAEGAARVVAEQIIAAARGSDGPPPFDGKGSCYVEFGEGRVARVDIDFLSGPNKTGTFVEPSPVLLAEKEAWGSSRRARWFG